MSVPTQLLAYYLVLWLYYLVLLGFGAVGTIGGLILGKVVAQELLSLIR